MLIDWFTVGAQALNFLILVWLLKRFLYKPILAAIDAREQGIAKKIANAEKQKADALQAQTLFESKNNKFDQERNALLEKATQEAEAEHQRLLDKARKNAQALEGKRQQAWCDEQQKQQEHMTQRIQDEVFAISRKTLKDLADVTLEERINALFIQRLSSLKPDTKNLLEHALKTSTEPAKIHSSFDLTAVQKKAIEEALEHTFDSKKSIEFSCKTNLIAGIELVTNGQKMAWNIADYLDEFKEQLKQPLANVAKENA